FVLIGLHLVLVVYHGISEPPRPGDVVEPRTYRQRYHAMLEKAGVPFWPDAAWKDVVFAIGVGVILLLLPPWPAPPHPPAPADQTHVQADPRPDWYFLWYFALLALMPAGLEDYLIVGFPLLLGLAMISLPFLAPYGERSPRRRPWAVGIVLFAVVGIGALIRL